MGHCKIINFCLWALLLTAFLAEAVAEVRCKDESFCMAYCLSTNPDTVSARCGADLASCICLSSYNQAIKVRFIEERDPVAPTSSTTPPPQQDQPTHYVNSQPLPNPQHGNGNSIASNVSPYQAHAQLPQPQQQELTPVLLQCDGSDSSTQMCHLFCTMEIRAWYGLCNLTTTACACFGIPHVQKDPIAAIFHSSPPIAMPAPTPKPAPTPPPYYQQPYPQPGHFQNQNQNQQWRPIPSSYNYPSSPAGFLPPHNNQLHEQGPVRSVANMFGANGQPVSPSISTPVASPPLPLETTTPEQSTTTLGSPPDEEGTEIPTTTENGVAFTSAPLKRHRRSLNDMPLAKENASTKDLSMKWACTKYKCGIACKRNNYLAPDCEPKCLDGECMCECHPRN